MPRDLPTKRELQAAAAILGRKGGKVGGRSRSSAKTAASAKNGKLGGRPRKHAKG